MRQILFNSFLVYLTVKSLDKWLIFASLTSVIPNMLGLFTACAAGVVGARVRLACVTYVSCLYFMHKE